MNDDTEGALTQEEMKAYRNRWSLETREVSEGSTCGTDTVDPSTLQRLGNLNFTAAEIVESLDTAVEDWDEGRYDHEAHHNTMANIWKVAEAAGVADAARRIICTR